MDGGPLGQGPVPPPVTRPHPLLPRLLSHRPGEDVRCREGRDPGPCPVRPYTPGTHPRPLVFTEGRESCQRLPLPPEAVGVDGGDGRPKGTAHGPTTGVVCVTEGGPLVVLDPVVGVGDRQRGRRG